MSARPGLCGGHQVTGVPTAISKPLPRRANGRRKLALTPDYDSYPRPFVVDRNRRAKYLWHLALTVVSGMLSNEAVPRSLALTASLRRFQ
jgi:hypothetical protein